MPVFLKPLFFKSSYSPNGSCHTILPLFRLIAVNVNAQPDENSYRVWIEFYVVNHPTPVIIDTFLERLR